MPLLTTGAGKFAAAGAAAYSGAGDVVSGAYAWYGLRGYNAAYATGSNPALILVDQAGANQVTINILANGRLDVASISAWVSANSVSTIKVKQMHDQTGNARHVLQNTLANMPVLNLTGFGSLPAVVFTAASSHYLESSGTITQAQPITQSVVYTRGGSASGADDMIANGPLILARSGDIQMYAGAGPVITASDGSWHAVQAIFNSASSAGYVDGSATTGIDAGTAGPVGNSIAVGKAVLSGSFDGSVAEFGFWPSGFNGTQAGNMNTNQHHATNGYNF